MKLVTMAWVVGGLAALGLGMGAEACATSTSSTGTDAGGGGGSGTNCAALTACCATLNASDSAQCPSVLAKQSDSACASFLSQIMSSGLCASSGSGSGTGTGVGTGTGTGVGTGTGTGTGVGTDAGTGTGSGAGTDAGTGTGSGVGTDAGTGTGTGSGTGTGAAGIPTTCAEANGTIGCCGSDGKDYYCATGSTTVKATACATGSVCTWNGTKSYGCGSIPAV
jgi:hypothetical protein